MQKSETSPTDGGNGKRHRRRGNGQCIRQLNIDLPYDPAVPSRVRTQDSRVSSLCTRASSCWGSRSRGGRLPTCHHLSSPQSREAGESCLPKTTLGKSVFRNYKRGKTPSEACLDFRGCNRPRRRPAGLCRGCSCSDHGQALPSLLQGGHRISPCSARPVVKSHLVSYLPGDPLDCDPADLGREGRRPGLLPGGRALGQIRPRPPRSAVHPPPARPLGRPPSLGCDPTAKPENSLLVTTAGKLNFIFDTSLPFLLLICLAPSQSPHGFGFNMWP